MYTTTFSRFGIALALTSLVIGLVGFAVYMDGPTLSLQPVRIHRHASTFEISSAGTSNDSRYAEARAVLVEFIDALERSDDSAMRAAFPEMSSREARILNSIRRRLGGGAELSITSDRLTASSAGQLDIDFVILAKVPDARTARRLPFHAALRSETERWVIATLY